MGILRGTHGLGPAVLAALVLAVVPAVAQGAATPTRYTLANGCYTVTGGGGGAGGGAPNGRGAGAPPRGDLRFPPPPPPLPPGAPGGGGGGRAARPAGGR